MQNHNGSRHSSFGTQWNNGAESIYPEGPLLSNSPPSYHFETPSMQQNNVSQMPQSSNPFLGIFEPRQTELNDRFVLSGSRDRQHSNNFSESMGTFNDEPRLATNVETFHPGNSFQGQGRNTQPIPVDSPNISYITRVAMSSR